MKILVFGRNLVSKNYIGLIKNIKQLSATTNHDKDDHQNKHE